MAEEKKRRRAHPKDIGGAPLPMAHEDPRVEWWNAWAEESYARMVFYLDKARRCFLDTQLKPFGISSAHMPVLTYLWEGHDGDTQSVIADVINIDPATVTRVSQRLEELGYIERTVSGRDSRARCLRLTEPGWALADPVRSVSSSWSEQITSHMSPRRRKEILRALQRITVRAQEVCEYARLSGPDSGRDVG